jgi:Flp pilus assembly protein TadD
LWRGLGYARFKRDYDKAIADYSQALRIEPKNARAYALQAGSLIRKGDDKKAEADLTRAQSGTTMGQARQ